MPPVQSSYSPTAGLPFDDEELESKLVWIWGSPRTGSTWLLEMLCHPLSLDLDPHSDLGFNWRNSWKGQAPALPVDGLQISGHLAPGVFGHSVSRTTIEDEGGSILPRTLNRQAGSRSTYAFSVAYEDVWRPEARRLTLVRLHAIVEHARRAGLRLPATLPLLVIKEVDDSHAADVVMSLFPRSRMILMVRDGRDVIDSLLDANSPGGWLTRSGWGRGAFESTEQRLEWMAEHCRNWAARMNVCRRAYEAHDPALRRILKYEDLIADTPTSLTDIARWLQLPAGTPRINDIVERHSFAAVPDYGKGPGKFRRSGTRGTWRDGLTPVEQDLVQEIMGRELVKLGYEGNSDPS
jgi:hypothetical protein